MRKALVIAFCALTRTARDRKALLLFLLMPMILIGILGSALQGLMGDGKINPFDVLLINEDVPARPPVPPGVPTAALDQLPVFDFGKLLADDVLGSDEVRKVIRVTPTTDLEAAKGDVAAGKAVAVIYVPPTFTADALAARPATVQVFSDPGHPTQAEIVAYVVSGFTAGVTSSTLRSRILNPRQVQGGGDQGGNSLLPGSAGAMPRDAIPRITEVASGARNASAMQYYAAAMAIMFMLMTAFSRAGAIITEREDGTLARVLVSPTSKATVLAGQILGSVALVLAQFIILMLGTRFLFGVYWGEPLPALLLGTAFALAAAGIGTAAASILRDSRAADASVGLVGTIFAALSGSMFPLYIFPDGLKTVARFIPNYWALQGFLDQMAGLGQNSLWLPVSILALIGVATAAAGAWRLASK
ncbi:MAG: ABC transporter permease [Bacillota bacterium]